MQRFIRYFVIGWWVAVMASDPWPALSQSSNIVLEIVVEGAQRVEPDTVRSYMLIQEGDLYDARRVDRSLKSLFATGLFADVTMQRRGDALIVTVVENPVINRIAFEGNNIVDNATLESEVTLRPRIIYTRTKVQNDVQRILTIYRQQGRFAATADPKVIQLPQNRVDLVFEISEGSATEIERIRFIGNREFDDDRLRESIRTRETRWYRFFSVDDKYDPDRLTLDRELLRRFYLSKGFADFRVVSALAEMTPDRQDFFLTFTVDEGARYRFGKIEVEARLRDLDANNLLQNIEIEEQDWYDSNLVEKTIDDLTDQVGTRGYAFVDVRPRIARDRETREINVTFEINEGPRVFVERIDISGNVRSLDKVVRREMRLVEGDAFNRSKVRRSAERIQNLDFFENVTVEEVPGSAPDKTIIKVEVEEKSTGTLSLGAGFSSTNGALVEVGVQERNLLGRGWDFRLNSILAQRQSQIDLRFTDPAFLDREITAGFDVFRTSTDLQDTSSFDRETLGVALRGGYPITERLSQRWKYTQRETDISDIDSSASRFIQSQSGSTIRSEISHRLTYDRRDSTVTPTKGYFVRLTNDVAGLGGDASYFRNRLGGVHYYSFKDQWVLASSASGGVIAGIGEDVRLSDRFFVGGDELRGFADAGIGPRDTNTRDALGGEWFYLASLQLTLPSGLPPELGISARVFTDWGSQGKVEPSGSDVSDTGSLRASIGAGVSWESPFGPVGLDFGIPLLKESFDVTEIVRVNFGARF